MTLQAPVLRHALYARHYHLPLTALDGSLFGRLGFPFFTANTEDAAVSIK